MKNTAQTLLDRRHLLWGAGASCALLATSRPANAQPKDAAAGHIEEVKKIAEATAISEQGIVELTSVLEDAKLSNEERREAAREILLRTNKDVYSRINSDSLVLVRSELNCLWRHEFYSLATTMGEFGLNTQEPEQQPEPEPEPAREPQPPEGEEDAESCLMACLYVVGDVLGLPAETFRAAVLEVMKTGTIYTVAVSLGRAAKRGELYAVASLAKQFFTLLFGEETLKHLRRVLGNDALFERMLAKVGKRFLPWVGPILLAGDVSYAVWNHWDSIKSCRFP
jgi:hypothetical protein